MKALNLFIAFCMLTCGIEISAQTVSGIIDGHDYVDLGLPSGTKWATCNVGAEKTIDFGEYFAWGETKPKTQYGLASYVLKIDNKPTYTKYVSNEYFGSVDNKIILESTDDAANVIWGGKWRMPTLEEQQELIEGCEWVWTDNYNGTKISGKIGISKKNENTIFLPAAGYKQMNGLEDAGEGGYYWSSSLDPDNSYNAYRLDFGDGIFLNEETSRFTGRSIRAVVK